MNAFYSDVIQFAGSHYDFGFMQGEQLKTSPILKNRKRQWASSRKRHFKIDEREALKLFERFMPRMRDEIKGLADALGWTMTEAVREFGGYYVEEERSGCSILTGDNYIVRNYDSDPAFYEGRFMIYEPTDGGYATIGPSMQITGRTDGMNEKGLVMGYNFINRVGSEDGFVCNMIGRMILENSATIEEAIDLLKAIPHRTAFNYVVSDLSGDSYVVEASPRKVIARKASVSTNHFHVLLEENRYRTDESIRRERILLNKSEEDLDVLSAYELLNNDKFDVYSEKYDAAAGTIHTAVYLPKEQRVLFTLGKNRMPVIFNFGRHLAGETNRIKQIKGLLDYEKPFVNMENSQKVDL